MRARRPYPRVGFTLVEMLVVIAIVAILAALLLPALYRARESAQTAQIVIEVKNLERGFEAYKEKYGDYPPDFTDPDLVRRHIYTAWPNIAPAEFARVEVVFWSIPAHTPNPAEALVFWSGGFSSDPRQPFTGNGGPFLKNENTGVIISANPDRLPGSAELDQARLIWDDDRDGRVRFPVYPPPNRKEPYVYFDARTYGGLLALTPPDLNGYYALPGKGVAKPYLTNRPSATSPYGYEWANKTTFQIISAGLDGHYGSDAFLADHLSYPIFPDGVNYLSPGNGDDDNVTNFCEGRLKDKKP